MPTPTYPSNVATVTVTGTWVYSDGSGPATGIVTFAPNVMLADGTSVPPDIVLPKPLTVTLVNGAISVVLMATDDTHLLPAGWAYQVTEKIAGQSDRSYYLQLPAAQPTVDLAAVSPLASAPALVQYASAFRKITAGTGLTGGGDLTADRTLAVAYGTTAGTAAQGNDTRIVGAVQKTAVARSVKDFGVKGDGSEEGAAIQAAITTILGLASDAYFPPGTYKSNTGLSWDPTQGSVYGIGQAVLDFTGMSSGYAITLNCSTPGFAFRAIEHEALRGVRILGPQSDTTTVDGFKFVGAANSSMIGLRDLSVNGFRDQFFYDVNTWCITLDRVAASHWARYSLNLDATTNAGENYNFYGCTFFNATNATTGTATAVYTSPTGNADAAFHACSFDYNDYAVLHQGGMLSFHGCHFEGNNANPFVRLTRTSDPLNPRTALSLFGGVFVQNEAGNGRDHLIEVMAGAVNGVRLTMHGVQFQTFGRTTTVFKNLSTSVPRVSHVGCDLDNTGSSTQSATMGHYTNLLVNGDMEGSPIFGASAAFPLYPGQTWTKGGLLDYQPDTTVFRTGTRSVRIPGTGAAGGSNFQQMIAVIPRRELLVTFWVKATITSGSSFCRVSWYMGDYTTRVSVGYQSPPIATQDWTAYAAQLVVPPGVVAALIDVANTDLNGTIWVDDVVATMP